MRARNLLLGIPVAALALLATASPAAASEGSGIFPFARGLSLWWIAPFAGLLLSIAVLPLVAHHWWENNRNRAIVAAVWALPVLVFLLQAEGGKTALLHSIEEYVAFIALLGSLFVISGGILITGDIRATPKNNTVLLLIGGVLANFIGTTGASMLLIRPLLRINSERQRTLHTVVFFIFIVSNCGGCLTPLGDPPLFLGYLRGVPFEWTLVLWKEWALMVGMLLAVFFAWDSVQYGKETPEAVRFDDTRIEPIRIRGNLNFVFLAGVIASVLFLRHMAQVAGMTAMAVASVLTSSRELRKANGFNYGPINEVAILFAGIFVAMVPALQILQANADRMPLHEPWQFFVATGALSSFLDNAPTYLTFFVTALGLHDAIPEGAATVTLQGVNEGRIILENLLVAISLGAVFMGSMTYIGNGPNFMVKAIAESAGQKMPSFFGYMIWSVGILGPLLAAIVFIFLL